MNNCVRRVTELPQPFHDAFSSFQLFNAVQSDCFHECFHTDINMVIAAPTGSGKTVTLELCMLRLLSSHLDADGQWCPAKGLFKIVYVAPTKALIQERVKDWSKRYGHLNMNIMECTGDSAEALDLTQADVIATTPYVTGGLSMESSKSSATIPNVYDIAKWIKAPKEGCKVFGEEMRPVTIKTVVKAFPSGKNDFLFERNLNEKVFPILQEHWQQKPVIIFCSSRKGTVECCSKINEASKRQRVHAPSFFVKNAAHQARLREAAEAVQDKPLAEFIIQGLAWHHAAMSQEDRSLVEQLFVSRDIMCISATATLAQGVNLPAFLVIIKGTQRYCSDGGKGPSSYQEYDQGECLQMIGRAGRPQFESSATAVIMTKSEHRIRYQNLGAHPAVLQLKHTEGWKAHDLSCRVSTEFLNAEIAQGIVTSVSQAHAWLQKSLFWVRVFQNPTQYGITDMGITPDKIAQQAMHLFVDLPLKRLKDNGLIEVNDADGSITPKDPSLMMCKHCMQLATMVMIHSVPNAASPRDLLEIVCKASENADVMLRRTEKKVLNALNQTASEQERNVPGSSYMVREATDSIKRKQRLSEPWEKSFVLVNACLAAGGVNSPLIDYSMISDSSRVIQNGMRIATCMIRYYEFQRRFAAMTAAIRLHRALLQKMWDGYQSTCRQVPGVGNVLVQRLAAAGIRSIADFASADARHLELVTTRLYPWGDTKREDAKRLLPPPCSLDVQLVGGNRVPKVKVTVHCTVPGRSKAFCWLVVGCLNDDSLMLSRYLDVASTTEPTELTAMLHSNISGDHRIVAAILSEKVIGGDTVTPVSYTCAQVSALQQARTGKIPPTLVNQDACLPESTEVVEHQDKHQCQPDPRAARFASNNSTSCNIRQAITHDANAVSGSLTTVDPVHPATRPRAGWVSKIAQELDEPDTNPPHQPSEQKPLHQGVCQNPAVTQQLQTLAQRVEHVKQLSTKQQPLPPDCHTKSDSHSHPTYETSRLPEPLHCSKTNTYAGGSAQAPQSSPAEHGSPKDWCLTTFHAPESNYGADHVLVSNSTCHDQSGATTSSCTSIQPAAAQETAPFLERNDTTCPDPSCVSDALHCKETNHLARSATHDLAACPDTNMPGEEGLPREAPVCLPQAATPAMSQHPEKRKTTNGQESSAILSCSSHVQPSPDSPMRKPAVLELKFRNAPATVDNDAEGCHGPDGTKQSPVLGAKCVSAGTAASSAPAGATQVSRRATLKSLIRRARTILSSNLEMGAHPGQTCAPVDTPQHVHTVIIDTQQSSGPPGRIPALQPVGKETQRAGAHATGVNLRVCGKENEIPGLKSVENALCPCPASLQKEEMSNLQDMLTGDQEPECLPMPNFHSYQQPSSLTEASLKLTESTGRHESAAVTEQKAASNTPAVPVGIWNRFKARGELNIVADAPTSNEEGSQVMTDSCTEHSMWSTFDGPVPVPEAAKPTSDSTVLNTPNRVTKTRSLVQSLLIGRQNGSAEAAQADRFRARSPQSVQKSTLVQIQGGRQGDGICSSQPMTVDTQDAAVELPKAHESKAYIGAFDEQDIILSPDPPCMSVSVGKASASEAPQASAASTLKPPDLVGDVAAFFKEDGSHALRLHEACERCAVSPTQAEPVTAVGAVHLAPEQCQLAGNSQGVQDPMLYKFIQTATPSSVTEEAMTQLQKPMLLEETKTIHPGSNSLYDEEARPCLTALQTGQDRQQQATAQEPARSSGPVDADVHCSSRASQHVKQQKLTVVVAAHTGQSPTSQECVAAAETAYVNTGSHGNVNSSKQSTPVLKFPRLPKPYAGKRVGVGATIGAGNVAEQNGQGSRKGSAAGEERRLGGVSAVTQTRAEPAHDNKGLKRPFKVPRNK